MISKVLELVRLVSQLTHDLSLQKLASLLKLNEAELYELLQVLKDLNLDFSLEDQKFHLLESIEPLDAAYIYKKVKGRGRVEVIDSIDSTNTELLRRVFNLGSGDCLIAEYQSAARGRRERKWQGALGRQVTLSLSWEFASLEALTLLSVAVGVEIAQALEAYGFLGLKVKWPNDLYWHDGKLGGILVETRPRGQSIMAIIGVGINLKDLPVHNERYHSTSLDSIGKEISRNDLAVLIIDALRRACFKVASGSRSCYIELLSKRDYLSGKEVRIDTGNQIFLGLVLGINDKGELLLKEKSGHILNIAAGQFI